MYTIILCLENGKFVKYRNVKTLKSFQNFAKKKGFRFYNIYEKSTRLFIKTVKN